MSYAGLKENELALHSQQFHGCCAEQFALHKQKIDGCSEERKRWKINGSRKDSVKVCSKGDELEYGAQNYGGLNKASAGDEGRMKTENEWQQRKENVKFTQAFQNNGCM